MQASKFELVINLATARLRILFTVTYTPAPR
jgi:hypothetical protein